MKKEDENMITELKNQDFYKVRHLTDKSKNIEIRAIVDGNNPGRVYVDHPAEPTAALIWIEGQKGFQIVGDVCSSTFLSDLEGYMRTHIEPQLQKKNVHCVEIGAEMDTWGNTLDEIFNNRNISSDNQHVFRLMDRIPPMESQDHELTIQRIDKELLYSKQLDNHSFLEQKIYHFWDSLDSFLQHGFGYIAIHNNNVVSSCFSSFVADQTHAIDIETLEEYRRKNYGVAVARAFVEECIQRGLHPYWDCTPENKGSIRLAESIGMTHYFDYQIYYYKIQ